MLLTSTAVLGTALTIGLALALLHLLGARALRWTWPAGAVHGLLGMAGYVALVLGLRGPPRGVAQGAGSFGAIAAGLLGLTLLAGGLLLTARLRRRRMQGLVIGVHATLAVTGFIILAAYASLPG
jgi:hypothetical protein